MSRGQYVILGQRQRQRQRQNQPSEQSKEIKDKQTNRLLAQTSGKIIGKGSLQGTIKEEEQERRKAKQRRRGSGTNEIPKRKWKVLSLHLVSFRFVSFGFVSFVSSLLPLEGAAAAAWKSVFCFPFDKFTHDL